MNNNLDFLNKTEINSFVYSSIDKDNATCKNIVVDGRTYTKWGNLQIVTFVGMMFAAKNKDTGKTENFIMVGISKQHPQDIIHNKRIATEVARENALLNPVMILYNVSPFFDNFTFKQMMSAYHDTMDLDMVLTHDECKKKKLEEFNNEWDFYLKTKKQ